MGKYAPLNDFLSTQERDRIPMSFSEIEELLDRPLPASKQYPAWWSNNPSNNPMTREWLAAGFETESVNTSSERLVFRRVRRNQSPASDCSGGVPGCMSAEPAPSVAPERRSTGRHPGFGFMRGLIRIETGFDITKPFDDEPWDEGYLGGDDRR